MNGVNLVLKTQIDEQMKKRIQKLEHELSEIINILIVKNRNTLRSHTQSDNHNQRFESHIFTVKSNIRFLLKYRNYSVVKYI